MDDYDFFTLRLTLPLDHTKVISTLMTCNSPVKKTQTILEALSGMEQGSKTNKFHTHSVIYTNLTINTLRARIKLAFNIKGNGEYSLKKVENLESALSYTIKDKNYAFSDKWETIRPIDDIEPWIELEANFNDQVKELDKEYLDSGMDDDSYLESLLTIYSQKHALYIHHIRSHWLALYNRRNRMGSLRIYSDPEDQSGGYIERQVNPRQLLVSLIKNIVIR